MNATVAAAADETIDTQTVPVLVDYTAAATPRSATAKRLAAEAATQFSKLGNGDNRAGKLRTLSTGRADFFTLNPYLIKIKEGRNSRMMDDPANLAHIDDLARSIAVEGVKSPVTVSLEGDDVFLTDGHCRLLGTYRAIEVYGAEIKAIPVVAESRFATEADYVLRQVLSGKAMSPLEVGVAYVKMAKLGWTSQMIADKSGKSKVRIEQVLDLMAGATPTIQKMVAAGQVAAATVSKALHAANYDPAVAEKALISALKIAESKGKTRATPKHMAKPVRGEDKSGSLKMMLHTVLAAPTTTVETNESVATITISVDDWKTLMARLGRINK